MPDDRAVPPPITAEICDFVAGTRPGDIPPSVTERGHVHMLDALGLADGTTHEGRADFARGSNRQPMSWDDIAGKFRSCLAAAAIAAVAEFESLDGAGPLVAALAP